MDLRTLLSSLSSTSRSFVVSTTKVIQQLKTRVVTCSRINCYVFKVYWSAGTQINEPIDWGTITRKWKTILGFFSPLLLVGLVLLVSYQMESILSSSPQSSLIWIQVSSDDRNSYKPLGKGAQLLLTGKNG